MVGCVPAGHERTTSGLRAHRVGHIAGRSGVKQALGLQSRQHSLFARALRVADPAGAGCRARMVREPLTERGRGLDQRVGRSRMILGTPPQHQRPPASDGRRRLAGSSSACGRAGRPRLEGGGARDGGGGACRPLRRASDLPRVAHCRAGTSTCAQRRDLTPSLIIRPAPLVLFAQVTRRVEGGEGAGRALRGAGRGESRGRACA